jgi:hypothetical protein
MPGEARRVAAGIFKARCFAMSVSIYYAAKRPMPITKSERLLIDAIVRMNSVDKKIEKYLRAGEGLNWESFAVYDKASAPDVRFEGATKLPDNTKDATWEGVWHWCWTLSYIRLVLHDASWRVAVESHKVRWDENERRFDPSA